MAKDIIIKGARENNLKNIDVTIPRDKLVVLTGLSGSGKSSLAFDTIYAEGQRKYMESLSSYARQFLGQMEKPDVEYIEGLSPAISIDQKTTNKNPRSTVGTVTEIYDYLRLMYARIGIPHCPVCGREITSQTIDQIVELLMLEGEGTKLTVMAPVVRQKKGQHEKILERIRKEGFTRVRVDGEIRILGEEEIKLGKTFKHTIEIVVDRIIFVGTESEGKKYIDTSTEIFDVYNNFIMPGFNDFHVHLVSAGLLEMDGILRYMKSEEEAARYLCQLHKDNKNKRLIMGGAWDPLLWPCLLYTSMRGTGRGSSLWWITVSDCRRRLTTDR